MRILETIEKAGISGEVVVADDGDPAAVLDGMAESGQVPQAQRRLVVPVNEPFFEALADASINVEMISTSEIRISVVTRVDDAQRAVVALHTAFGLDADGEAVVYGGTGR